MPSDRLCRYIFGPEDTSVPRRVSNASPLEKIAKTLFWLAISVLIGLGIGQLA